jgi:hypothetical protein
MMTFDEILTYWTLTDQVIPWKKKVDNGTPYKSIRVMNKNDTLYIKYREENLTIVSMAINQFSIKQDFFTTQHEKAVKKLNSILEG